VVSLTQPAVSGMAIPAGVIVLQANAYDLDGSISKVQFFDGPTLLGQVTQAPYTFSWSGGSAGGHSIHAVATDNRGAVTLSGSNAITILADTNSNGIPDHWEIAHFGSLNEPATGDFDGDGVSNLNEYLLGRNPTEAAIPGTSASVDLELFTPLEE
jgi:hypothetical protein